MRLLGKVRRSKPSDYPEIKVWDEFWGDRRQEMQRGELFVFEDESHVVLGYISCSHNSFLNYPFISTLCVHQNYRRRGVATRLLVNIGTLFSGTKYFTSTEPDNLAANRLFVANGFKEVGILRDVNFDGSSEIFYVKGSLLDS